MKVAPTIQHALSVLSNLQRKKFLFDVAKAQYELYLMYQMTCVGRTVYGVRIGIHEDGEAQRSQAGVPSVDPSMGGGMWTNRRYMEQASH